MKLLSVFFALTLLCAAPAIAADAPPTIPVAGTVRAPTGMPAGLYTLDGSHAHAVFFINHLGFSEYTGDFHDISGTLVYRPDNLPASKLDVTIKTDSINVQSAALKEKLIGPDFFNAEQFPEIKFISKKLIATSRTKGKLTGDLTMHGVTKPITLDVRFVGGGVMPMSGATTMGFAATGQFKRSDYGINAYLPGLGDDIILHISAEFTKTDTDPGETKHAK